MLPCIAKEVTADLSTLSVVPPSWCLLKFFLLDNMIPKSFLFSKSEEGKLEKENKGGDGRKCIKKEQSKTCFGPSWDSRWWSSKRGLENLLWWKQLYSYSILDTSQIFMEQVKLWPPCFVQITSADDIALQLQALLIWERIFWIWPVFSWRLEWNSISFLCVILLQSSL